MVETPKGAPKFEAILIDTAKVPWREKSLTGVLEKLLWRNNENGASSVMIKVDKGAHEPAVAREGTMVVESHNGPHDPEKPSWYTDKRDAH